MWFFRLVPYALALIILFALNVYYQRRRALASERQLASQLRSENHLLWIRLVLSRKKK